MRTCFAAWYTASHLQTTLAPPDLRLGESEDSPAVAPAHGIWGDGIAACLAIEEEARGAVGVCAEGTGVGGLELGEDLGSGMAEAVAAAAGDDGPGGVYRREKGWARGSYAAVMANFEDGALQAGFGPS